MPTAEIVPNGQDSSESGHGQWTGLYTAVDEGSGNIDTSVSDTIYTRVNNRTEFYDWSTDSAFSGKTISQIEFFYHARKANSGGFTPQIYNSGTYYDGTAPTLTTSWATYSTVWTTNPATSVAWTSGAVDAIIAGFIQDIPRGAANWSYIATTWIIVTYTVGYGNDVNGIASGDISKINGIPTANISKINGV